VFPINIAFFLTPKKDLVYLSITCTMRQALERMEYNSYTAVPLIDEKGRYAGTLTEGDLLWKFKNTPNLTMKDTEKILLSDVPLRLTNQPVRIYAKIQDLLSLALDQNFVPVIDDNEVFIGIVRRREIMEHFMKLILAQPSDKGESAAGGF
jgi:CBS domain-containing protein